MSIDNCYNAVFLALFLVQVASANQHLLQKLRRVQQSSALPDGKWTSRGYGYALNVSDGSTTLYDETDISCILNDIDLAAAISDIQIDGEIARLSTVHVTEIILDRGDSFSRGCANDTVTPTVGDVAYSRDALRDFDIFDQTFAEYYAFFELRGVDWEAATSSARANLTSNSTDEELFKAFTSLVGPLNDRHVSLSSPNDQFESKPFEFSAQLLQELNQQETTNDLETYKESQFIAWNGIIISYMDSNGLIGNTDTMLLWGRFREANVGYMQIMGMADALLTELDTAFATLNDTEAMVVDVRVNDGGSDTVSLLIASHFTSERTLAFTKRAGVLPVEDATKVYVDPVSDPAKWYGGKVVLITSGSTVSAAEIFTIAMSQLPQVTRLGRNTSGSLSDILPKSLPNGWKFGLSNEIYADPEGVVYEAIGVPPDVVPEADLLPLSERESGIDSWLELALQTAMTTESPVSSPGAAKPTAAPTDCSGAPSKWAVLKTSFLVFLMTSILDLIKN